MVKVRGTTKLSEEDPSFVVSQLSFWKTAASILVLSILGLTVFFLFLSNFSSVFMRNNTLTKYTMSGQKISSRLAPVGCSVFTTNVIGDSLDTKAVPVNVAEVDHCLTVD